MDDRHTITLQLDNPGDQAFAEAHIDKMRQWLKTPLSEQIAQSTSVVSMRVHKDDLASLMNTTSIKTADKHP